MKKNTQPNLNQNSSVMENTRSEMSCGLHLALKIAKLALTAATVAAAFCVSHEVHKVHRAIDRHRH